MGGQTDRHNHEIIISERRSLRVSGVRDVDSFDEGGAVLKKIGTQARKDIEEFFGIKANVKLWVKVKENWRDSVVSIANFGLNTDE